MNVPLRVVRSAMDRPLPVIPVPLQGPKTTGPPAPSRLSGSVNKSKPTWPPTQSPLVPPVTRPPEKTKKKGLPIQPRPHFSTPPSIGRLRKSHAETCLIQEQYDDVVEQFTSQRPLRIAEERGNAKPSHRFRHYLFCQRNSFIYLFIYLLLRPVLQEKSVLQSILLT